MQELRRPRQGGLRAVRFRVPPLSRHRRIHERAEGSAEREGMMRRMRLLRACWPAGGRWRSRQSAPSAASRSWAAAAARRAGVRVVRRWPTASPTNSGNDPAAASPRPSPTISSCAGRRLSVDRTIAIATVTARRAVRQPDAPVPAHAARRRACRPALDHREDGRGRAAG